MIPAYVVRGIHFEVFSTIIITPKEFEGRGLSPVVDHSRRKAGGSCSDFGRCDGGYFSCSRVNDEGDRLGTLARYVGSGHV